MLVIALAVKTAQLQGSQGTDIRKYFELLPTAGRVRSKTAQDIPAEELYQRTMSEYMEEKEQQKEEETEAREKTRKKTPHKEVATQPKFKDVPLETFWSQGGT